MFTGKTRRQVLRVCILLFFCLVVVSKIFAEEVLVPKSTADYGSGASAVNLYYPGGIPANPSYSYLFLGHANQFGRNDRALVRFMISPYVLCAIPTNSATLCFGVTSFSAPEDIHEIEITHLLYESTSFSANDLLNSRAEIVELMPVNKNEPADKEYSVDVTKYVNADIATGNIYSAFRFRDVTAETKTRPNATSAYGIILKNLLQLKLR